jgi:hypothetical protein
MDVNEPINGEALPDGIVLLLEKAKVKRSGAIALELLREPRRQTLRPAQNSTEESKLQVVA